MVQLANVSKGCAVDYDKYSKMLAINNNHKYDDADFNEFVPATTEEEYINITQDGRNEKGLSPRTELARFLRCSPSVPNFGLALFNC